MIRFLALCLAAPVAVAALLWAGPAKAASAEPIDDVTEAQVRRDGDALVVTARGRANTGGYTDPRLSPAGAPSNGVLVVDFLLDPPPRNAIVTMALTPHRAELTIPASADIRTVEVRGANASVTAKVP